MLLPMMTLAMLTHAAPVDTTFSLARGASIEVDAQDNDITVHVGGDDRVTVRGATVSGGPGAVEIGRGRRRRDLGGDDIVVTVPAWVRLTLRGMSGSISVDGATAQLDAQTIEGDVTVSRAGGEVSVGSVSGDITVNDFTGTRLHINGTNGDIAVHHATGAIHVDNINGDITLTGITSSDVSAQTVSGAVTFDGPLAPTGSYSFGSHNDDITLWLPADVSARLSVSTLNGDLVSRDLSGTTHGSSAGSTGGERQFTVTYGGGAARVTVDAFNGDVVVKKGPRP